MGASSTARTISSLAETAPGPAGDSIDVKFGSLMILRVIPSSRSRMHNFNRRLGKSKAQIPEDKAPPLPKGVAWTATPAHCVFLPVLRVRHAGLHLNA